MTSSRREIAEQVAAPGSPATCAGCGAPIIREHRCRRTAPAVRRLTPELRQEIDRIREDVRAGRIPDDDPQDGRLTGDVLDEPLPLDLPDPADDGADQ